MPSRTHLGRLPLRRRRSSLRTCGGTRFGRLGTRLRTRLGLGLRWGSRRRVNDGLHGGVLLVVLACHFLRVGRDHSAGALVHWDHRVRVAGSVWPPLGGNPADDDGLGCGEALVSFHVIVFPGEAAIPLDGACRSLVTYPTQRYVTAMCVAFRVFDSSVNGTEVL